jgi:hypothetical protein
MMLDNNYYFLFTGKQNKDMVVRRSSLTNKRYESMIWKVRHIFY